MSISTTVFVCDHTIRGLNVLLLLLVSLPHDVVNHKMPPAILRRVCLRCFAASAWTATVIRLLLLLLLDRCWCTRDQGVTSRTGCWLLLVFVLVVVLVLYSCYSVNFGTWPHFQTSPQTDSNVETSVSPSRMQDQCVFIQLPSVIWDQCVSFRMRDQCVSIHLAVLMWNQCVSHRSPCRGHDQ